MHRSKLAGFIIDCQTGDVQTAADFWSAALGMPQLEKEGEQYVRLDDRANHLAVEVQKVAHASRVHLDIESDDLDAEAARLEKLGAKRIEFLKRWWIMEAPTGQRFCIVRKSSPDFDAKANTWE